MAESWYPWGAGGNSSGGAGTGGPAASLPTEDANVDCRFGDSFWTPWNLGSESPTPTTPTQVYKLTECTSGAVHYTTPALTDGIEDEVGNVINVDEYASTCWAAVELGYYIGQTLEALTITDSYVNCDSCTDPVPCTYPSGDPPSGLASTYTVNFIWDDPEDPSGGAVADGSYNVEVTWTGVSNWWAGNVATVGPGSVTIQVLLYLNPVIVAGSTCCVWRVYVAQETVGITRRNAVRFAGASPVGDYTPTNTQMIYSSEAVDGNCEVVTPDSVLTAVSVSA